MQAIPTSFENPSFVDQIILVQCFECKYDYNQAMAFQNKKKKKVPLEVQ